MPEVSVVIASYNHGAYLEEAIESVLEQTLTDLELIVVDDGSTDDSVARIERIGDPRLRLLRQDNQGAHVALDRGLRTASAEICAILNSDDVWDRERLARLVPRLQAEPAVGLVGSYLHVIDGRGRRRATKHGYHDLSPWPLERPERSFRAGGELRAALLTENYFASTSNFVLRRAAYAAVGPFRALRYVHDWDLALRIALEHELALVAEPLLSYRQHGRNTIGEDRAAMAFEICWLLAVHLPRHAAAAWFSAAPPALRADQLLHSIYTFGLSPLLSTLLTLGLAAHPERAAALLDPADATRARLLAFARMRLDR